MERIHDSVECHGGVRVFISIMSRPLAEPREEEDQATEMVLRIINKLILSPLHDMGVVRAIEPFLCHNERIRIDTVNKIRICLRFLSHPNICLATSCERDDNVKEESIVQ